MRKGKSGKKVSERARERVPLPAFSREPWRVRHKGDRGSGSNIAVVIDRVAPHPHLPTQIYMEPTLLLPSSLRLAAPEHISGFGSANH